MQPRPPALLLAAAAATFLAGAASAQNIDTTPAWDGLNTMGGFGGTPTYGQTITAPVGQSRLDAFSFYIDARGLSLTIRAAIYAWDAAQQHAVGSALWQSPPVTVSGASGTIAEYTFAPPGGVPVTPGQRYVLLGTTLYDAGNGPVNWGWLQTDPYAGGEFVYLGSTDSADLTSAAWASTGTRDLVFKAAFAAAVPAPPPVAQPLPVPGLDGAGLVLLGLALAGAAGRHARRQRKPRG